MIPTAETDTDTTPDTGAESRFSPMYRVLVHNDDVTPMNLVVEVLTRIFHLEYHTAVDVMYTAHNTGIAHVVTEPLERAEFHVDRAHSIARGRGYPLTFTCEPEE